jgi:hypothetical protein
MRGLFSAIFGAILGVLVTVIVLDNGEVCKCYEIQGGVQWTDSCPAEYVQQYQGACPDNL